MSDEARSTRVAVLGGSGIGRVHVRILTQLGASVVALLGSSAESAARTAAELSEEHGLDIRPHHELDALLAEPLDAVSICTPAARHLNELRAAWDRQLAAFCEKPLFWDAECTEQEVARRLDELEGHPHRRLWVNTSNPVLLDAVRDQLPAPDGVQEVRFVFHTNGSFEGADIALDLLPHGLSLLLRHLGARELEGFEADVGRRACECRFRYGDASVTFEFQERADRPRRLAFAFDDASFERVTQGTGATYRVGLEDTRTGEQVPSPDPFAVYLERFLAACRRHTPAGDDEFASAATNLRLMARCADALRAAGHWTPTPA